MRARRPGVGLVPVLALGVLVLWPARAHGLPAFARRYGVSCHTCHEFHFPRLSSFGDAFKRNGYQLPGGAEDPARARRMLEPGTIAESLSLFKEIPLSVRGGASAVATVDHDGVGGYQNKISSYLAGGGTVARDVSYVFSLSAYPDPVLHHAAIGLHNLGRSLLGDGSLNLRAGLLLLLDFARPSHRALSPGSLAGGVRVGRNPFRLDDSTLGVQVHGRPCWGPFAYEVALVAGPPGVAADGDEWKDVFARASYVFFQNTAHEASLGLFGYLGRADLATDLGGVVLAQRDDFWVAGLDAELDVGPFDVTVMGYLSRHGDPALGGEPVALAAARAEGTWGITTRWDASLRLEWVESHDDHSLGATEVNAHVGYLVSTNVLAAVSWRHDLRDTQHGAGVMVLEAAF